MPGGEPLGGLGAGAGGGLEVDRMAAVGQVDAVQAHAGRVGGVGGGHVGGVARQRAVVAGGRPGGAEHPQGVRRELLVEVAALLAGDLVGVPDGAVVGGGVAVHLGVARVDELAVGG